MNKVRIAWFLTWFGLLGYLLFLSFDAAEVMPMRFDSDGNPVATISSKNYFIFAYGFVIFMNMIFAICTSAVVIKRVPSKWWNLPYKAYWFAPDNIDRGSKRIARMMAWGGIALNVTMAIIYALVNAYSMGEIEGNVSEKIVIVAVIASLIPIPAVWIYLKPNDDKV